LFTTSGIRTGLKAVLSNDWPVGAVVIIELGQEAWQQRVVRKAAKLNV